MARFFGFLIAVIIVIISRTVRLRVYNREVLDKLKKEGRRVVFSLWHQEVFLFINYYKLYYNFNRVAVLVSPSRDGDIAKTVLDKFGFDSVRGSSRRGGLAGMIELIKLIKNGKDAAFVVDGPTGPKGVVKPGILLVARRTDAVVLPVGSWASPNIKLFSWDRLLIPIPFSRGCIVFGKPIEPGQLNSDNSLLHDVLQKSQEEVSSKAKQLCD